MKKISNNSQSFQSFINPGKKAIMHNFAVKKGDPAKVVVKAIATAAVDSYQKGYETPLDDFINLLNGRKC